MPREWDCWQGRRWYFLTLNRRTHLPRLNYRACYLCSILPLNGRTHLPCPPAPLFPRLNWRGCYLWIILTLYFLYFTRR